MTMPEQEPLRRQRALARRRARAIASLIRSSAGWLASSSITFSSPAVMTISGPIGRAPCDTHGPDVDAAQRDADRALVLDAAVVHEDADARTAARAGDAADHRQARVVDGQLGEQRLDREGVGVGQQEHRVGVVEHRHAGDGDRVAGLERLEVEGLGASRRRRTTRPTRRRRRPRPPCRRPPRPARRSRSARASPSRSATAARPSSAWSRLSLPANTTTRSAGAPPSRSAARAAASANASTPLSLRRQAGSDAGRPSG